MQETMRREKRCAKRKARRKRGAGPDPRCEVLRGLQVGRGGLAALAVGLDVEGNLLPLGQAAHPGALDRRDVNEHVRAAAVLRDEAEAFLAVEELNCTGRHDDLLKDTRNRVLTRATICASRYPDSACS